MSVSGLAVVGIVLGWMVPLAGLPALNGAPEAVFEASTSEAKAVVIPVVSFQASEEVANLFLEREVVSRVRIAEQMMGAFTTGTAVTQGEVEARFVPSPSSGIVDIVLTGRSIVTDGVARQRNISVYTTANTAIHAVKRVQVSLDGLQAHAAAANCTSAMWIHGVDARPLIRRLAMRRAQRLLPEAERNAANRTGARVRWELDREADPFLEQAQKSYDDWFKDYEGPTHWLDQMLVRTTARHLLVQMRGAVWSDQLEPAPATDHFDIGLVLHEQFPGPVLDPWIAGQTVTDEQFLTVADTIRGRSPRALWVYDGRERWEVTFAADEPLALAFDADMIDVALRFQKVVFGSEQLVGQVIVTTRLAIEPTVDGPHLRRVGDVEVVFEGEPGSPQLDADEVRVTLEKLRVKMAAFFPTDLYFDGLTPPAGGTWGKLRRFELTTFATRDGWLVLGYEDRPSGPDLQVANPLRPGAEQ